jgi:predicted dehydrogenase
MAKRKLGIGVIGMGWMGAVHSRAYLHAADRFPEGELAPELVLCADEVAERAGEAQARFGFAGATGDWRQVVADPRVEVVDIAAPNRLHLEIALAAAAAGKHIFCEKPVGRSPQETSQIALAARRAGVLSWVGYNYRWTPLVQHALGLIGQGKLGRLTHYRGRFFAGYASNPKGVLSWRFRREEAGSGVLGDLMSHVVDMAQMLAGPIGQVVGNRECFIPRRPLAVPGKGTHFSVGADGPLGEVSNEDYAGALVRFANGAHGSLEVCRVIQGPQCQMAFEVHGTEGALRWDFERMNELEFYVPQTGGYTRILGGPEHPFHARFNPGPGVGMGYEDLKAIEAQQFLESIARQQQGQPGLEEALAVARVLAAMERSWESRSWEEVGELG